MLMGLSRRASRAEQSRAETNPSTHTQQQTRRLPKIKERVFHKSWSGVEEVARSNVRTETFFCPEQNAMQTLQRFNWSCCVDYATYETATGNAPRFFRRQCYYTRSHFLTNVKYFENSCHLLVFCEQINKYVNVVKCEGKGRTLTAIEMDESIETCSKRLDNKRTAR